MLIFCGFLLKMFFFLILQTKAMVMLVYIAQWNTTLSAKSKDIHPSQLSKKLSGTSRPESSKCKKSWEILENPRKS